MQVYVLDEMNHYALDEHRQRRSIEVEPCSDCMKHQWNQEECAATDRAVKLVLELAKFECEVFIARGGSYSNRDLGYEFQLGHLICPLKQPCEYDSRQIGLLQGVLELAAFIGPSDIEMRHLVSAYGKVAGLVGHIHNDHRNGAREPLAPSDWFGKEYPQWVPPEQVLYFLPDIRGKSLQEVGEYLQREWDALERCTKCRDILLYGEQERGSGVCFDCDPTEAESVS